VLSERESRQALIYQLGGEALRDDIILPPTPKQKATKTILIVEDDADLAWTLTQFFRHETGYVTMWTHKGSEALQAMKGSRPDLLLLDYRLPDMNGLELYDQFSTDNELASIPAILVTANLGRLQREVGRRTILGIDKPFDLDTLREAIDTLLA
jgi:CheY-like chemotaxis protein